jgi:hypothetical protein
MLLRKKTNSNSGTKNNEYDEPYYVKPDTKKVSLFPWILFKVRK